MNKKVSIVVPVYNVEKYIAGCLDSILAQSYENIEVIIVDDGSTDESGAICDQYGERDLRIKVLHKENGGLSDARNCGLQECIGEYVAFIDGDDYVSKYYIEHLLNAVLEYNADISTCRFQLTGVEVEECKDLEQQHPVQMLLTESGRKCQEIFLRSIINVMECKESWEDSLIRSNVSDKLFRRSLYIGVSFPVGKKAEDLWVIYGLLGRANRVVVTDAQDYYYYQRSGSIMHSVEAEITTTEIEAYNSFYADEIDKSHRELLCLIIMRLCMQRYRNILKYEIKDERADYIRRIARIYIHKPHGKVSAKEFSYWCMLSYCPWILKVNRKGR